MISSFRIFEIILYALINMLPYLFIALYPFKNKFRFSRTTNIIILLVLITIEIGICLWASIYSSGNASVSFANTIIYSLLIFITIKEHPGKLLFILLMISNIANQIVFSAKCLEGFLFPSLARLDNKWSFSLTTIIMQLIFLPYYVYFLKKKFKDTILTQIHDQMWSYLWLIPGTFYLFWFFIAYFSPLSGIELALHPIYTIFAILINSGALLMYYIINKITYELEKNMELCTQNDQLIIQNLQYKNLKLCIDETRQARHDLRQHMTVLHTLYKGKQYEQLDNYLQKHLDSISFDYSIVYCEHFTLNALLIYYAQMFNNHHINFDVQISFPQNISINDMDITILFGNLLENAFEGCMTCSEEQRKIILRGSMVNQSSYVFTLDNTFFGSIQFENGRYLSTKHDGIGIGIESIKNIVNKYNGTSEFKFKNNIFYISIMLNLK